MRKTMMCAGLALAIAGCSGGSDEAVERTDGGAGESATAPTGADPVDADDTANAAPQALDELPEAFRGQWDFTEEDCSTGLSEMQLELTASEARYYESTGVFADISQTSEREVVAVHGFSGEGEEWEERLAYELNEDGDRLTVTQTDGSMSVRIRCP